MNFSNQQISLRKYILLGCFFSFLALFLVSPAKTVDSAHALKNGGAYAENDMKAIYLYNFHKFIRWPENSCTSHDGRTHVISVIGETPLEPILIALQEKLKKTDRDLKIIFYGPYRKDMVFNCCCLMFIAESERHNLPSLLDHIAGKPILTVTDISASVDQGIMINMVMHQNKVRWVINRRPINESGLKLSAKLLDIAVKVVDE